MPYTPDNFDLDGRKHLRLRLRPNLVLARHEEAGQAFYVVKDPISLAYFRLDEGQHFLVQRMDGQHTLAQLRAAYEEQFRPARLSLDELEDFALQLLEGGLVQNDSPSAGRHLFERSARQRQRALWERLANPFCVRLPLLDPDRVLARLLPIGRVFFSPWCVVLASTGLVAALLLVATHWQQFHTRLPDARDFFSFRMMLYFWLALGLVKVLHELGHGLCCKVLGGEVQEMGVLVLFFFPTLYCNVSDSWTLRGRWRRMAVGAAGMYVELVIATMATFVWWLADPGTALHRLSFALLSVCGVNTILCNANPLMRFDGYFILADGLGVPNLSEVSTRCLQVGLLRWLGVPAFPPAIPGRASPRMLGLYAVASQVYRCMVVCGTLYYLCDYLKDRRLSSLGQFLILAAVLLMFVWPVVRFGNTLRAQGRLPEMKMGRVWLTMSGFAVVLLVVFVVPLPLQVRGLALIQAEPGQMRRVTVPEAGGFLKEILVRDGQDVRAGEVLAVLENPKLEIKLRLAEAERGLRLQQQAAQVGRLAEPGSSEDDDLESWLRSDAEYQTLSRLHADLQEQTNRLVLRAPCDGTVLSLKPVEDRGKWFDKGAEVCTLGNGQALRALVLVEPSDRKLVAAGAAAAVRVHGDGSRVSRGVVTSTSAVAAQNIPGQLSHHAGGEVPTHQDPVSKAETPQRQHFLIAIELQEVATSVHPGVLGRVRIEAGAQTLWWRCRRYLATTVNFGL